MAAAQPTGGEVYWECPSCTLHNDEQSQRCDLCETAKPADVQLRREAVEPPRSDLSLYLVSLPQPSAVVASPKRLTTSLNEVPHWVCPACTFHNEVLRRECEICGTTKPRTLRASLFLDDALPLPSVTVDSLPEADGSWGCTQCTFVNGPESQICRVCHVAKPPSEPGWSCLRCTFFNQLSDDRCTTCDLDRPAEVVVPAPTAQPAPVVQPIATPPPTASPVYSPAARLAQAQPRPTPSSPAAAPTPLQAQPTPTQTPVVRPAATPTTPVTQHAPTAAPTASPVSRVTSPAARLAQAQPRPSPSSPVTPTVQPATNPTPATRPAATPSPVATAPRAATTPTPTPTPTPAATRVQPTTPTPAQPASAVPASSTPASSPLTGSDKHTPTLLHAFHSPSPNRASLRRSGSFHGLLSPTVKREDLPQTFQDFRTATTLADVLELWAPFQLAALSGTLRSLTPLQRLRAQVATNAGSPVAAFLKTMIATQTRMLESAPAVARKRVLVVGAGPCGLFQAILLQLLGADVTIYEARESYERNNVLHIWPTTLTELQSIGIRFFFTTFCTGELHHVSIKALQLALTKIALIVGCDFHRGVRFLGVHEAEDGWRVQTNTVYQRMTVDILVAADGERGSVVTQTGSTKTVFQAGAAIGVTANFVRDKLCPAERRGQETNVASHFARESFARLAASSGLHCENLVYFKDDTHYLVFCPRKASLLEQGILRADASTIDDLLRPDNVDYQALERAVRRIAGHVGLPQDLRLAMRGPNPDMAVFDFTAKAAVVRAWNILHKSSADAAVKGPFTWRSDLLVLSVGDAAIAPFWPQGTGIARGFLCALDNVELVRSLAAAPHTLPGQAPLFRQRDMCLAECKRVTPEALRAPRGMALSDYIASAARYRLAMAGLLK